MELSQATGGWSAKAHSAEALERLFLRLFEQTTPADCLPLRDNRLQVDHSVRDMTVLVFRGEQLPVTRLRRPDGAVLSEQDHPADVNWHHERYHDMLIVKAPEAGPWQLLAAEDPDNRVLVATNLGLAVDPLPDHLTVGQRLVVRARLAQAGGPVRDTNLLRLVKLSAALDVPRPAGSDCSPA